MNVLITAPSLNEFENVSGISTIVRTIIRNNGTKNKIFHFKIGTEDGKHKSLAWALEQAALLPNLAKFIRKNRIDIIHLNTALTGASLLRDFILFSFLKKIIKKPVLLHIHGGPMIMTPPGKKSLYWFIITWMLKNSNVNVVLSQIEQQQIMKNFGAETKVLPNAVEPFVIKPDSKIFNGKIKFIFIGRIVREKGIYLIANAFEALSKYHKEFSFTLYGAGKELIGLLKQLKTIQTLEFEYKGIAKGPEKWEAFKNANIFLLPSLSGEGLPVAMLEAMHSGCIPIVSNDASITTVVENNVNGFIVEKGNQKELVKTIESILIDTKELSKMSNAARTTITDRYSISSYMETLNLYYSNFFNIKTATIL